MLRRILSACSPDRIILFGSAATGSMQKDSDIDLLVLLASPQNPRDESVCIRRKLRGIKHAFDIIVMPTHEFDISKSVVGGIAYPAQKYGRVVYEA